jgi:4a-hydroxytetrahydrobiopterin dehydratase
MSTSSPDSSTALTEKRCGPCSEGGDPMTADQAEAFLKHLHADWSLSSDARHIARTFAFKNFYQTISFVNAVAHVANREDHHPDLEVSYNRCRVSYTTHAIGGLSENDFICAAKVDDLAE